jgi:hypothetical protein
LSAGAEVIEPPDPPVIAGGQNRIVTSDTGAGVTFDAPLFATNSPESWTIISEVNPPVEGVDENDFFFTIESTGQLKTLQSLAPFGSQTTKAQVEVTLSVRAINAGGLSSPEDVTVTIVDPTCIPPTTPVVSATDGTIFAAVLVSWDPVPFADEYQLSCGFEADLTDQEICMDWTSDTFFYLDTEDVLTTAEAFGCTTSQGAVSKVYILRARNNCGDSPDSTPETGFAGPNPSDFQKEAGFGLLETALLLALVFVGGYWMKRRSAKTAA